MTIKTLDTDEKSVDAQPHYMRSFVFLDDTGHLQIRTNTYSHVWFVGFHGGIVITLTDKSGKLLYASPVQVYGVDGSQVPFGTANRWDTQDYDVGQSVAQQTDRIDAILFRGPDANLAGFVKSLEDAITVVEEIWQLIYPILQSMFSSSDSGDYSGGLDEGPTQVTVDALTPALGTLITSANPTALAYGQQVTFAVSATDSNTGAAVEGLVYKALSLPLDQGATLLGTIGQPITTTLSGQWSLRPQLVRAQPALAMRAAPILVGGGGGLALDDVRLTRPEFGRRNVDIESVFMPENLYVRTRDYGDVAVPFVLTGKPDGSG